MEKSSESSGPWKGAEPEGRRRAPSLRSELQLPPDCPSPKGEGQLPHETAGWRAYLDLFASSSPVWPAPPPLPCAKAALLIEPRAHPLLEPVARHFASLLAPYGWALIIAHGSANEAAARAAAARIAPGRVGLVNLGVPDLPIPLYNVLLKTPPLWTALRERGVQKVLVFQTDTLLLRRGSAIESFLGYDYVGAPWRKGLWPGCELFPVGNGGLSLRSVAAMLHVTEKMRARIGMFGLLNEDYVLARICKEAGFRVPTPEVAAAFSAETVHHPAPVGLHKPHLDLMPPGALRDWLAGAARDHFGAVGEERVRKAACWSSWKVAEPEGRRRPPDCPSPKGEGQFATLGAQTKEAETPTESERLESEPPSGERPESEPPSSERPESEPRSGEEAPTFADALVEAPSPSS